MSTKSSTRIVEIPTVASDSPRHTPKGAVALVMNAGTDNGCRIARDLVRSGCRVAVSGRPIALVIHAEDDTACEVTK